MFYLIRFLHFILSRFPLPVLQFIGKNFGSLMYHTLSSRRNIAFQNCKVIGIDEREIPKIVKSSFRNTFCSYVESFFVSNIDEDFLNRMIEVEYVGCEKPANRGHFVVSAHFGGWELAPYVFKHKLGLEGAAIARKIKDERIDNFIKRQRQNAGIGYIHHRGASEAIKEYIDKDQSVGALLDHSSMPKDSFIVPFFGIQTSFIKGIPLLSVRKDYPVLPLFVLRKDKGFRLIVLPVIHPDKSLKPKERAYDMALRINRVYEDIIRKHPDQWYLIHKRFKRVGKDGKLVPGIYR